MANTFQMPNMYNGANGQYVPPPYFPQTPGNGPHHPPFPQGVQHPPAFAAQASNQNRFEANNHAPSPPILNFQLPPNLNFEELKNYVASQGYALPPPPPPIPLPGAFSSSLGQSPYPAMATNHPQYQQHQNLHQPRTPVPAITPPGSSYQYPASLGRSEPVAAKSLPKLRDAEKTVQNNEYGPIPGLEGTVTSRLVSSNNNSPAPQADQQPTSHNENAAVQSRVLPAHVSEPYPRQSAVEKHGKARAAIAEITSVGITYKNLVDEGINEPVLAKLFNELGLDRMTATVLLTQPPTDVRAGSKQQQQQQQNHTAQPATEISRHATNTPQPEAMDPTMERKDRIAQLLAARKAQAAASAISSQSTSPAPAETLARQPVEARPTAAQSIPSKSQPPLSVESEKAQANPPAHTAPSEPISADTATQKLQSLPTPMQEEMKEQAFSIPGLFMISADQVDPAEETVPSAPAPEVNSRKRSAEPFSNSVMPQPKRQISQSAAAVQGTAAEDSVAASQAVIPPLASPSTHLPGLSDGDKAVEPITQVTRGKINQDRLKDRMAALKADLLRKKSRKEALQDGMPELDAEIEETRERLSEQRSRLAVVRQNVQTKEAELAQAQDEESSLVQNIERLERQLADGESGQKQFSKELHQLNDQIVAEERESSQQIQPQEERSSQAIRQLERGDGNSDPTMDADNHAEPINNQEAMAESGGSLAASDISVEKLLDDQCQQEVDAERSQEQIDLDHQLNAGITELEAPMARIQQNILADPIPFKTSGETTASTPEEGMIEDSGDDRMSIDEFSDADSTGSASMSDSGSEEYEPAAGIQDIHDIQTQILEDAEEYEPAEATPYHEPNDAENDDYEPAEQVDVLNVDDLDSLGREPKMSTPPQPESVVKVEDDTAVSSPTEDAVHSSAFPTRAGSVELPIASTDVANPVLTPVQPPIDLVEAPVIAPEALGEDQPSAPRFVPYQSPLANFKSFRFHPQYNEIVKNGYRSLTYSNRIDPKKPICQNELEGQTCDDNNCDDQHFGAMALSDDKILVQMSSANDIKDKNQRDQYLLGLKKVIADLREQGVKEFSEVANALSKYRREWMASQDGILT